MPPPTLESIEASLASTETWVRWLALLAAMFTISAAGAGVRLWLLQRTARPLREKARLAAEERIASLHQRVAEANKAASEAAARAAEANKSAAEANEKAEKERLARVKIEARMAPRRLSSEQHRSLVARLNPFAGEHFWVITETNDRDPGAPGRARGGRQARVGPRPSRVKASRDQRPRIPR